MLNTFNRDCSKNVSNIAYIYSNESTVKSFLDDFFACTANSDGNVFCLTADISSLPIHSDIIKVPFDSFFRDVDGKFSFDSVSGKFAELRGENKNSSFIIDLSWIQPGTFDSYDIARFAAAVDRASNVIEFSTVSCIDIGVMKPDVLIEIIKFYPWLHYGDELFENIYHIPHDVIFSPNVSKALLEQYVKRLRDNNKKDESVTLTYKQLKLLSENMHDVVFCMNQRGIFTYISPSLEKNSNFKVSDVVGQPFTKFVHPEDLTRAITGFSELMRNKSEDVLELRGLDKDGVEIKLNIFSRGVKIDNEIQISGVIRTAGFLRPAGHELSDTDSAYDKIFENMSMGAVVHDITGKIIAVNRAAREILGVSRDDILARDSFSPEWEIIDADGLPMDPERHPSSITLATGKSATAIMGVWNPQLKERKWIISSSILLCGESFQKSSKGDFVFVSFSDITHERQVTQDLKNQHQKLRVITDNLPVLICHVDSNGILRFVNRAFSKFFNKTIDELTGMDFRDLIFPEIKEIVSDHIQKAFSGTSGSYVLKFSLDNKNYCFNVEYVPEINSEEVVVGFYGLFHDVSDFEEQRNSNKKLEDKIRETQRMESLGVLAGGIAHDFNNLLVGILGNAGLALLELSPTNPARSNVEQIEKAAFKSAELCKQMLAYSGKGRYVLSSINLSSLIDEMSHLLEASLPKNVVLKFDCAKELPPIDGDISQIQQVIMNLVINAGEAIDNRSGIVTISTGTIFCDSKYLDKTFIPDSIPEGTYVYLEVSDTGCGIPPEIREKIFDPFFSTKFTGRGLGLAAVIGIIRGHRGSLKIYSEVGHGTTIKVMLPIVSEQSNNCIITRPRLDQFSGSGTILIVDDEEWVRKVASRTLSRAGYSVITATNGLEAVEIYEKQSDGIDAVLLDMTMPHMDGREAFQELRRINENVAVLLSSGYNEKDAVNRFAGKGLAGFIQKPYHPQELLQMLSTLLKKDKT